MPKAARLPSPPDFRTILRRGAASRSGPLTVFSVRTQTGRRRAGIVVRSATRRLKSHERQRARRVVREVVRQAQHTMVPSIDLVVMLQCRPDALPTFQDVHAAFQIACANQHLLNASV